MKREKGITLTALVITIIVVLILAGITINLTVGQDGIITKAQQAAKEMKKAEIKDTMKLDILTAETEAIIRGESLEKAQLNDIVAKYGELQEDGDTIITKEDKFEISLKEIWYGVLSDSGSYTDKIEQIEILEKELADLRKQYEELEKLNEGNLDVLNELNRRIAELEEQKRLLEEQVATLTSEKEELTSENTRLAESLVKLNEEYQAFKKTEGTATAGDILSGKTAWVNGSKITGTMVNRGALNASLNAGQSYTVPVGYTTGGTITANSLASQTVATATADDIAEGKTAYVNGKLISGTGLNFNNNPKLLWKNTYSASSATFPSQTISLDLSSYDAIILSLKRVHTSTTRWYFTIPIGMSQVVNMYMNGDETNVGGNTWYRLITTSKNGVTFGNSLNDASCNYGMLPCEIYGIKNFNLKEDMES